MNLQAGDIVFVVGRGWIANTIRFFMGGTVTHVGIMYSDAVIFETDGKWRKARFNELEKYDPENLLVYRFRDIDEEKKAKVQELCIKYDGAPYSYWDCFVHATLSPFNRRIRGWFASKMGNSLFMKCDELTKKIAYEAFDFINFKHAESGDPQKMLEIVERSNFFYRVL